MQKNFNLYDIAPPITGSNISPTLSSKTCKYTTVLDIIHCNGCDQVLFVLFVFIADSVLHVFVIRVAWQVVY